MEDVLKKAILGLKNSSDFILVKNYLLEKARSNILEATDNNLPAEEFKIDRISKEKAYNLLVELLDFSELREPRKINNASMR